MYIWEKDEPSIAEDIITIDSHRHMYVPKNIKTVSVVGDNNASIIRIQLDRYWDGKDFADIDCVIRYTNAKNEYGEEDSITKEVADDKIILLWSVSNYVTRYAGYVKFTVQFEEKNYQWQTVAGTLFIRQGVPIDATAITDKDDTTFRQLANQVQGVSEELEDLKDDVVYKLD